MMFLAEIPSDRARITVRAAVFSEHGYPMYAPPPLTPDALGAVFFTSPAPECGTRIDCNWLRKHCVMVNENTARVLHPELFENL